MAATGKAHPQAVELANHIRNEFIERKYITEDNLEQDTLGAFDVCASDTNLNHRKHEREF